MLAANQVQSFFLELHWVIQFYIVHTVSSCSHLKTVLVFVISDYLNYLNCFHSDKLGVANFSMKGGWRFVGFSLTKIDNHFLSEWDNWLNSSYNSINLKRLMLHVAPFFAGTLNGNTKTFKFPAKLSAAFRTEQVLYCFNQQSDLRVVKLKKCLFHNSQQ